MVDRMTLYSHVSHAEHNLDTCAQNLLGPPFTFLLLTTNTTITLTL